MLGFTPQVRASLTALGACREIAIWRGERQGISPQNAVDGHLERKPYGSGPFPDTLKALDYWGRPYLYLHDGGECFVLVSYGSDGKPDSNETYDLSLCRETTKRSTCAWPTKDLVIVNGEPLRFCLE
jgi:hypothetical protein